LQVVSELQSKLRNEDLHAWRDETNIPGSSKWTSVIEAAIERMDALVVVVTHESVASKWVKRECTEFLSKGKPVIPYIADPEMRSNLPPYLSSIQYIDGTVTQGFPALVKQLRVLLAT